MCDINIRKHSTQMTIKEKNLLREKVNNFKKLRLSSHVKERMTEKNISKYDIFKTLKNYKIVEFHRKESDYYTDDRVVIRSKSMIRYRNICLCISLTSGKIITAYSNYYKDKHKTIDMDYYSSSVDVRKYIEDNRISSCAISDISEIYA